MDIKISLVALALAGAGYYLSRKNSDASRLAEEFKKIPFVDDKIKDLQKKALSEVGIFVGYYLVANFAIKKF